MTLKFNRIELRFELRLGIVRDDDALGVYDYEGSTQGRGFRSNRGSDDLFAARGWLQGEGFTLTETKKKPIGRGQWGSNQWVEHWSLYPQPEPPPEPPRFRTIIQYDRRMHCYAIIDGIDALAHAPTSKDAYWL